MTSPESLPAAALRRATDPATLGFATTADLPDLEEIVAQERAVAAVRFAIGIRRDGYNLFALGPAGTGKHTVLRQFLARQAATEPVPDDWCYVHDFARPQVPRALRLPAGRGAELRAAMERLVVELRAAIPAAFETDAYRERKEAIEDEFRGRRERALVAFDETARRLGVALIRTPVGMGLAPLHDGQVLGSEDFRKLPEDEQKRVRAAMEGLEEELQGLLHHVQGWEREQREKLRQLDRDVTRFAADHLVDELRSRFDGLPAVLAYLEAVEHDVVDSTEEFIGAAGEGAGGSGPTPAGGMVGLRVTGEAGSFRRYRVNLLVDNGATKGAPLVYEDNPSYLELIGRAEHVAQLGALVTDFTLIRAGALHRANGGYLVLDALKVLGQPFAWEALKRALRAREIRVESPGQAYSLISTVSLEPEPIPLEVKVALVGERPLYELLAAADPDFLELFKVQADFEEQTDRTPETAAVYARLIATLARREGLRPVDAAGVARILDEAARLAGDAEKLSTHMRSISDLLREADHLALAAGRETTTAADVQAAVDARLQRAGRLRERLHEEIRRGTILVRTEGSTTGQVNGLSVLQLGASAFGSPARITAAVRLGRGEVVDIEREVELGGPLHSKGVLILSGFLGARYAGERPLTLHASLVFEQSYGGVEGDSASLAELCALLSEIAELPLRQSLAVTGSVDQHGLVQPIGGVNEKIEGFFDVCAARGLTAGQGVLIPSANVKHLMLRQDVVEACADGRFAVWPVEAVDEAMELLAGEPAGERGPDGSYPEFSVNGRVERRLAELAERAREYAGGGNGARG